MMNDEPSNRFIEDADLREHVSGAARVINNAVRLEQSGNHDNTLCPGVDNCLQIIDVDSANAENRDVHIEMGLFDFAQTNWFVIRFRRRVEDWAKADVISAFGSRRARLRQAVRRSTDDQISSSLLARNEN